MSDILSAVVEAFKASDRKNWLEYAKLLATGKAADADRLRQLMETLGIIPAEASDHLAALKQFEHFKNRAIEGFAAEQPAIEKRAEFKRENEEVEKIMKELQQKLWILRNEMDRLDTLAAYADGAVNSLIELKKKFPELLAKHELPTRPA